MAKFVFDSPQDFREYVENWFSQQRKRNPDGFEHEHLRTEKEDDVAYIYFRTSAKGRVLTCAVRIPAKDKWLGFFPTFGHDPLSELPERLKLVNDHNHKVNPSKHPSTEEKRG